MNIIIIGAIILILILLTVIRRIGRRLTEQQIIQSQHVVNQALNAVLPALASQLAVKEPAKAIRTTLVANIWGHEVMAFECQLPVFRQFPLGQVKDSLSRALEEYDAKEKLPRFDEQPYALVLTDVWYQEQTSGCYLHLDIAHIINAETAAYLRDLAKLNQPL